MKKSDIVTVSFIAIIGFFVSFFLVQALVGDPDKETVEVKTIEVVSNEVAEPSSDTFNSQALNPTVEVFVGDNTKSEQNSNTENKTGD